MQTLYLLMLASGLLVFTSLLAGVLSARLGLPFLLVFLVAGMLVGVDGPIGLKFDNVALSAWVGNAALAVILLEGGLSTRMSTFRTGLRPALALATVGVALTAAMVGGVAMWVMDIDWRYGLLLGAIVGSTDAAAVFSMLRQSGVRLAERVSATLELESGLNDPMAVFLTLAVIGAIQRDAGPGSAALLFVQQAGLGALIGLGGAWAVGWVLRKLPLTVEHGGVLSLIIASSGFVVFASAGLAGASGFLAIYLFGMRVRDLAESAAHSASSALDGFAWAAQATLFLLLGLLVSPHRMLASAWDSVAIALTLIFVARPLAVWLCLAPLRFGNHERFFIGWVGLRGAVPIVLALFPLLDKVPGSETFFNVAFAVVLASLLLQGTTLGVAARWLKVQQPDALPPPGQRAVQGRLMLDADLPLSDTFGFFQLPVPEMGGETLRDWLTDSLARDAEKGDSVDWHGAQFSVGHVHEGRISRIRLALAPRTDKPARR